MSANRNRADRLLLAALATPGVGLREASERARVSYSTGRRRMQDPAFVAQLDELRGAQWEAVTVGLATLATEAVDALRQALSAGGPTSVAAARTVLDAFAKSRPPTVADAPAAALSLEAKREEVRRRCEVLLSRAGSDRWAPTVPAPTRDGPFHVYEVVPGAGR